jgi:hypothetical protein
VNLLWLEIETDEGLTGLAWRARRKGPGSARSSIPPSSGAKMRRYA